MLDPGRVDAFRQQLLELLTAGDSGSLDLINEDRGALLAVAFPDCHREIGDAIQGYDFETAQLLLCGARSSAVRS